MVIIKDDSLVPWLAERGVQPNADGTGFHLEAKDPTGFSVHYPKDVLDLIRFAQAICWQEPHERCFGAVLCITEWSIFGTLSDIAGIKLFKQICLGYGQDPEFSDRLVACHFDPTEGIDDRAALLAAVIICGWDALLVPSYGQSFVSLSHDGYACFVSASDQIAKVDQEKMQSWEIVEGVPDCLIRP